MYDYAIQGYEKFLITYPSAKGRDVALFLRIDDAELPVHDLQRLVHRALADPDALCGT